MEKPMMVSTAAIVTPLISRPSRRYQPKVINTS